MSDLATALAAVRDAVDGLEPGVLPVEACRALIEDLARTEKVCALARVRVAQRIAVPSTGPGRPSSDAAELLARSSGTSAASAKSDLTTVRALAGLPTLRGAVEAGELSLAQAHEIAKAAKVVAERGGPPRRPRPAHRARRSARRVSTGTARGDRRRRAARRAASAAGGRHLHERVGHGVPPGAVPARGRCRDRQPPGPGHRPLLAGRASRRGPRQAPGATGGLRRRRARGDARRPCGGCRRDG